MRNTYITGPCRALTASMLGVVLLLMATGVSAQRRPPNYSVSDMPETDFDCRERTIGGYYADPETECQMFHVCVKVPGIGVQDFRFLCPNDTAFDQEHQICDDWYNIDCESETLYLSSKFDLYRLGSAQTSSSPKPQVPKKAAPIPLGPSTPRALLDVPRPNPRPVNSNAVGRHDDNELQRADTGDRRLHSQRGGDLFRGASSGNFFNSKNGGKDDDDDYEPDSRYNAFSRQQKPSQTTTTTTSAPFNYQQQRKKKVVVHRKPVGQSSAEVNQFPPQAQPQSDNDEEVDDAYYNTYQDDQRSNIDSANQAFGQRGNFPATRTTAEPYYQPPSSSTQTPTQPPTAAQQTRARYNTIQRAQPTTEQPPSPSTQKAYSLFYQPKNINNNGNNNYQSTQAPTSQQYNNYRQPVTPSTTQNPSSPQYNNYRQPVNPSTTLSPSSQQYNNYRQPVNVPTTQSSNNYYNKQSSPSSSTDNYYNNNNYKQPTSTSSTTQAPFKYNNNNYYKQPVTTTSTQAPNTFYNNNNNANNNYNGNYNNNNYYRQPVTTSSTQTPNNYYSTTLAPNNYNYYTTTTTQAPFNNYSNQYKQPVTTTTNYYQRASSTQAPAYNNNANFNNNSNNNNANYYNNQNRFNNNSGESSSSSSSEEYEKVEEQEFLKTAPSSNYKPSDFNVYNRAYNKDAAVESSPKPAPFSQTAQTTTTAAPKQKFYPAAPSSVAPQPAKTNYYDQPRPFSSASPSTTTTKDYYQNYQTTPTPARKFTAKVIPSNAAPAAKTSAEAAAGPVQPEKSSKKNDYAYEYYDDDVGVYEYGEDPISDAHFSKIKTKLNKVNPTN